MTEQEYKKECNGLVRPGFWTVLNCNRKMRQRGSKERRINVASAQKVSHSLGIPAWNVPPAQKGRCSSQTPNQPQGEESRSSWGSKKAMGKQQKWQQATNVNVEPLGPRKSGAVCYQPHPTHQKATLQRPSPPHVTTPEVIHPVQRLSHLPF